MNKLKKFREDRLMSKAELARRSGLSALTIDRIEIRGFGSFISKYYPAYDGRNPRTGKVIRVAEKHLPFFKVGKKLRDRVDGKKSQE